jgi:hypothetical protein
VSDSAVVDPDAWLASTPYCTPSDRDSLARFAGVYKHSLSTKQRARTVAEQVRVEAMEILDPFAKALRTELVVESNRLEGYDWSRPTASRVVELHRELVNAPLHHFVSAMREDPHLMEVLGLYRAYLIADEWTNLAVRPREYEIRGLHAEILAGTERAGRYKSDRNWIGGSSHTPISPLDTGRAMMHLSDWWIQGSPDPVLDATVVHAWLTHIHPFDDGNGRLARLLANLTLTQSGYPPLIIRSKSDRGQYLDALAASDDGDILPLYDLFAQVLRRSVRTMARPRYVRDLVQDRLLRTGEQRYEAWMRLTYHFSECLRREIRVRGWETHFQGYPELWGYSLLTERRAEGNSWYFRLSDPDGRHKWLLFFGYNSDIMCDLLTCHARVPSVFVAIRDEDPAAVHPFRALFTENVGFPTELALIPGEARPAVVRAGYRSTETTIEDAAELFAISLTSIE